VNRGDGREDEVLEIQISVEMDRPAAEAVQLEATRLLAQHGLRVRSVSVRRAAAADADSAEVT
jgi:hypothetical protein